MRIPRSFKLGGIEFSVRYCDTLTILRKSTGQIDFDTSEILIASENVSYTPKRDCQEQTFCHELVHGILHSMSEHELSNNEKFVDLFATFLHQALNSSEGSIDDV